MICSASISNLLPALFKAQTEFPPVERDANNPHFNNKKYASLDGAIKTLQPILHKNDLFIIQPPASDPLNGYTGVGTWLFHKSGEFMAETLLLPNTTTGGDKGHAQSATAAVTYARRTGYLGILGVAPENEDDDGNTATGRSASPFQNDRKPMQNNAKPGRPAQSRPTAAAPVASKPTTVPVTSTKTAAPVTSTPQSVAQEIAFETTTRESSNPQTVAKEIEGEVPSPERPSEDDLNAYRNNFKLLCDDLSTFKPVGLQPSPKLPVNTKVKVFLLKVNNVNRAKDLTKAQWLHFFDRVSTAKNNPAVGIPGLITLINRANGVEEKK